MSQVTFNISADDQHALRSSPQVYNAQLAPQASDHRTPRASPAGRRRVSYDVHVSPLASESETRAPHSAPATYDVQVIPKNPKRPQYKPPARNATKKYSHAAVSVKAVPAPVRNGTRWTVPEDEKLLNEVSKYKKLTRAAWVKIGAALNRTDKGCGARYKKLIDTPRGHDRDPWQQEDVDILLRMKKEGKKWSEIGKKLNRTVKNCREYWTMFQHNWTEEDDIKLCEAWLNMYAEDKIQAEVLPHKTLAAVKERRMYHTGNSLGIEPSELYRKLQIAHNARGLRETKEKNDKPGPTKTKP
ncbi:hypothetical protein BDV96DRAFT_639056 [Lophiotrema nucula]|uniref:Homeodomain-like protein n=1 Tax=Lophiotrema nucula TaxID=690887 RepID=A0A6A5ZS23_9PLEO|nr:hypothetical protein BDV96DRAFT_639056 [Lophiotrema nucula]